MAIQLNKSITNYGDVPITATLTPVFSTPYIPHWELVNGSVTTMESNTVTLSPLNRTSNSKLTAYASKTFKDNSTLGSSMYWSGDLLVKDFGTEVSIAYHSPLPTVFYDPDNSGRSVWIETGVVTGSSERSFGFTSGINAGSYDCTWYISGSTAQCNIGSNVIKKITFANGDRLKVKITDGKYAQFFKNGLVVADYWFYPIFTQGYILMRIGDTASTTYFSRPMIYVDYPSESVDIKVYGVFPTQPNYPYDRVPESNTLISTAEDGSVDALLKPAKFSLPLNFVPRPREEMQEVKDFCEYHDLAIPFYFPDLVFDEVTLMRITSWRLTVNREHLWSGSVTLMKA